MLWLSACSAGGKSLWREVAAAATPPAGTLSLATGTAFFVSLDGTLLTARHVVDKCLRVDILSEAVAPTAVSVVASNDALDLALLRVEGAFSTPAALTMTRKSSPDPALPLTVYGYPLDGGARHASSAETRLANALAPEFFADRFKPVLGDPRYFIWLDGRLGHGYSGGPVLDKDGAVVGVVKGMVKKDARYNLAMGAGAVSVLTRSINFAPPIAGPEVQANGDDRAIRSAIVRVVCWRDFPAAADQ